MAAPAIVGVAITRAGGSAQEPERGHGHPLPTCGHLQTIWRPMLRVIRWYGDQRGCNVLIAGLRDSRSTDRNAKSHARPNRAATASEPKASDAEANGRRRIVQYVGATNDREAYRRKPSAILIHKCRLRCGLKAANQDMDRVIARVIFGRFAAQRILPRQRRRTETTCGSSGHVTLGEKRRSASTGAPHAEMRCEPPRGFLRWPTFGLRAWLRRGWPSGETNGRHIRPEEQW